MVAPNRVEHSTRNGGGCHDGFTDMESSSPLPTMGIAALVISIIALILSVMALPTVFQMFWGRPKLAADFWGLEGSAGKRFTCNITNAPVRGRILRRLGVRREPAVIFADFQVCEAGTNRILLDMTRVPLIDLAGDANEGSLRATLGDHMPVAFVCIVHPTEGDAYAVNVHRNMKTVLPPGRYRVNVDVICGDRVFKASREITVGTRLSQTYWIPL